MNEKDNDVMTLKLHTKFMKKVISKMITKAIYKKYGYEINIHIDNLDVSVNDGEASISTNVAVKLDNKVFKDIMKDMI